MIIAAVATDAGPATFRTAHVRAQTVTFGDRGTAAGGASGSGMLITRWMVRTARGTLSNLSSFTFTSLRAAFVQAWANNCSHQRSRADTADATQPGHRQVWRLPETTFQAAGRIEDQGDEVTTNPDHNGYRHEPIVADTPALRSQLGDGNRQRAGSLQAKSHLHWT